MDGTLELWCGSSDACDHGTANEAPGHFFNWYDTRELRPLDPQ